MELKELRKSCLEGLEAAKAEPGVAEVELFVSWNEHLISRLNYTSDTACNGVQEPKSTLFFGLGLTALFNSGGNRLVGFGSEAGDLTAQGVKRALAKARSSAVADPDFKSLPDKPDDEPSMDNHCDQKAMDLSDEALVALGWDALGGALAEFKESGHRKGLIVNGDVSILKGKMAVASTRGIDQWDAPPCRPRSPP